MNLKQFLPNATTVEIKVIETERSRLPPNRWVHILDGPPPGTLPMRNNPSRKSGSSEKINTPNANAI